MIKGVINKEMMGLETKFKVNKAAISKEPPVKISKVDIQHVAALAHLNLSKEEEESLARDMESIIRYSIDKLNELDTSGVEPMEHVLSIQNIFREDHLIESLDREELLRNAPVKADGYFTVPKVVEGK